MKGYDLFLFFVFFFSTFIYRKYSRFVIFNSHVKVWYLLWFYIRLIFFLNICCYFCCCCLFSGFAFFRRLFTLFMRKGFSWGLANNFPFGPKFCICEWESSEFLLINATNNIIRNRSQYWLFFGKFCIKV